MHPHDLSI